MEISVALDKLRTICSRQEKAPADIISFLKKWDVDSSQHQQVIGKLRSEKFIDDRRYATAFTKDKIKFEHWGFVKIRIMLNQKGIDKKITDEVIKEIDRMEYRAMIGKELDKKRKSIKGTPYEIWAKLARYGSSKGYAMEDMEHFLGSEGE
jgi:regulatory protein